MIPLSRTRTTTAIHANFRSPKRETFNLELMTERREHLVDPAEKQEFDSGRWKKAKPQLLNETNDKCAYCEAPTSVVAYGDVEHYRPKSKYWWLAYCYENYLPSCQLCNQKYKKAKFPVKNSRMKSPALIRSNSTDALMESKKGILTPDSLDPASVTLFDDEHAAEWAYVVNPYVDDPADWFAWEADEVTERVKLIPASNTEDAKKVVKAAEDDLGLNRDELQDLRFVQYFIFKTFKLTLLDSGISAATKTRTERAIKRMLANKAPFAGMLRYFDPIL